MAFSEKSWTDYGCTAAEASRRLFTPKEARIIRDYQRKQVSIDRMSSAHVQELAKLLDREPTGLRDLLASERRVSASNNGSVDYLNFTSQERSSGKTKNTKVKHSKPRNGLRTEWIPVSRIETPEEYQRALKSKWKSYGGEWSWRACGMLTVSLRNGRYYIVDGLQRLSAIRAMGEEFAPCTIVECQSVQDEANLFCQCNIDRTQLNGIEKFWAGVESNARNYAVVRDCIEANGFWVQRTGHDQPGVVKGRVFKNVSKLLDANKAGNLDETLKFIDECWTEDNCRKILQSAVVGGVSYLLKQHPDADFSKLKAKIRSFNEDGFVALSKMAKDASSIGKSTGMGGGGQKYWAAALIAVHNKCRGTKKLDKFSS